MANRINISVPDELMDDLNKYKEQLSEKVSVVCQNALGQKIKELKDNEKYREQLRKNPQIIEKLEELKTERENLITSIVELGKNDGTEFLSILSYSELLDMKFILGKYTLNDIHTKRNLGSSFRKFKITVSTLLKDSFEKNELDEFLSEVQKGKYVNSPYGAEPNDYYDEEGGMANIIIAKYLSKNFPRVKPNSGKTVYGFNKLYIGAFFDVLQNFYEIAKDQTELFQ